MIRAFQLLDATNEGTQPGHHLRRIVGIDNILAGILNPDGSFTARSQKILNSTPMNRFGDVSELIGSLLFLADDGASGFITGIVIPVDGGFNAYSGV